MNKIDENWDLFEHKTKIRTYLKKLDENWDQKGILTYLLNLQMLMKKVDKIKKYFKNIIKKNKDPSLKILQMSLYLISLNCN